MDRRGGGRTENPQRPPSLPGKDFRLDDSVILRNRGTRGEGGGGELDWLDQKVTNGSITPLEIGSDSLT